MKNHLQNKSNRQAQEALQRQIRQQKQLLETARYLSSSLDIRQVLTRIGAGAKEILNAYGCAIYLLEADGKTLRPVVSIEPFIEAKVLSTPLDVDASFTGKAVKAGQSLIFNYAETNFSGQHIPGTPEREKEHVIVSPFVFDDEVLGAMCLNRLERRFTDQDLTLAETFAAYAATALKNAQTHRELQQEVKEREQAEKALKESEKQFRDLFEDIPTACWTFDRDGKILHWNRACVELYGWTAEQAVGQSMYDLLVKEENVAATQEKIAAVFQGQSFRGMEYEDLRADGTTCNVLVSEYPLRDASGQVVMGVAAELDITARKLAEAERERLLAAEREQRLLAETLTEVTLALTSKTSHQAVLDEILRQTQRIVPYSTAHIALLENDTLRSVCWQGYKAFGSREYISTLAQPVADLPLDAEVIRTRKALVVADTRQEAHWKIFAETAWVRSHIVVPICLRDRVLGLLRLDSDIVADFSANDAQRLQPLVNAAAIALENARLYEDERASKERAQVLRQAAQTMGASLELDEILQLILKQLGRVMVYDTASVLVLREGQGPDLMAGIGFYDAQMTSREAGRLLENSPILLQMSRDLQPVVSADVRQLEGWVWVPGADHIRSWLGVPMVARGQMIGVLMMDSAQLNFFSPEDVQIAQTLAQHAAQAIENARLFENLQRHAAELEKRVDERTRELTEAYERLQELDRLKSKFVSDVSHELRTPVANIKLYLHLLHSKPERQAEYLQVIDKQTERLVQLVEDILNLSRLDLSREREVKFAAVDLNAVIRQAVGAHQPRAEAAGLTLYFEPDESLGPVYGEQNQLVQVVTNLVTNALNYTPAGEVRVSTGLDTGREQACLEVQDSGMGIEPEDLPHLFERFYRGERVGSSNIPGTGLGLAIVKEIVDLHGGDIKVESVPGQGSTFKIWLPLMRDE